jgi:hypothetical protein
MDSPSMRLPGTTRAEVRQMPPVTAQEAPISNDRHQQNHDTQPDLHPVSEPRWIDDLDQVVLDKSAT